MAHKLGDVFGLKEVERTGERIGKELERTTKRAGKEVERFFKKL